MKHARFLLGKLTRREVFPVVMLWIVSRLLLTTIGMNSRQLIERPVGPLSSVPEPLALWAQWDSGWYLSIAEHGYGEPWTSGEAPHVQTRYGFFPLYPLLVAAAGRILGGNLPLAGFLVSNAALLATCWLLYRYARLSDGPDTARAAVIGMIVFPSSFVLSAILTESVSLALFLASFYLARTNRWWPAGLAGCALATIRPEGCLAALPLAVEYWDQRRKGRPLRPDVAAILLAPLGTALVFAYFHAQTGDWWTYPFAKEAWGIHGIQNPLKTLLAPWTCSAAIRPSLIFGTLLSFTCLALIAAGWKKTTPAERALSLVVLVLWFVTGPNAARGMPRHLTMAFPLYLVLARGTDPASRPLIVYALSVVQGFAMAFWANGFPLTV